MTPLLFFERHPGIFNDHRESGPRFNVSSEGRIQGLVIALAHIVLLLILIASIGLICKSLLSAK